LGYTYDFKDNVTYGSNNINGIRREIMTAGVGPYAESCKVVAGSASGTVKITAGSVLLNDGSCIIFDSAGETLSITQGQKQYIYVVNDGVTNTNHPVVSSTEPTTGDYVMLAEVAANGTITDRRTRRQIQYADMSATIMPFNDVDVGYTADTVVGALIGSIDLPIVNPSYILLRFNNYSSVEIFTASHIMRVDNAEYSNFSYTVSANWGYIELNSGKKDIGMRVEIANGKINFYLSSKGNNNSFTRKVYGHVIR